MRIDSVWKTLQWTPLALAALVVGVGVWAGATPEPVVVLGLVVVQALVIGLPRAAGWLGQKAGEQPGDAAD